MITVWANPLWKTGDEIIAKYRADVKGKVAIVTGASSGIGKATVQSLSRFGCRVIAACKEETSGQQAIQHIKQNVGESVDIEYGQLDLASFEQIQQFADKIIRSEQRIDFLILNAAISQCPRMLTREGFEMQWGVNHLGHFHLVQLLLPFMRAQEHEVRIVVVTCATYSQGRVLFSQPNAQTSQYDASVAYKQSKLANAIYGVELSRRLSGTDVNAYIVNPGTVDTNINRYIPLMGYMVKPFLAPFVQTPNQGCAGIIMACVDPSLSKKCGTFIDNLSVKKLAKKATGRNSGLALWKVSETQVREAQINSYKPAVFDPIGYVLNIVDKQVRETISGFRSKLLSTA